MSGTVADLLPAGPALAVAAGTALAVAVVLAPVGRGARAVAPRAAGGRAPGGLKALASALAARRRPDDARRVRVLLAQVVALLRSGSPPAAAWRRAAGVPSDARGVPDEAALAVALGGAAHARSVVAATTVALDVGAPLGAVLETVADALVAEGEGRAEREAALAGPRATATVLLWLPAVGLLLGAALGADPLRTALDGGVGSAATLAGVLLLLAGRRWTSLLVRSARTAGEGAP